MLEYCKEAIDLHVRLMRYINIRDVGFTYSFIHTDICTYLLMQLHA